jgi:hypothetical protein
MEQSKGKGAAVLLREARDSPITSFDIFLSHSSIDKILVLGAKKLLEDKGLTVYVDWIDDPQLSRANVTRATADQIRRRMRQCKSMFYLHTQNAVLSKWCPWELGYFDAFTHPSRRVYVFPLVEQGQSFKGQEYLELYDAMEMNDIGRTGRQKSDVIFRQVSGAAITLTEAWR